MVLPYTQTMLMSMVLSYTQTMLISMVLYNTQTMLLKNSLRAITINKKVLRLIGD